MGMISLATYKEVQASMYGVGEGVTSKPKARVQVRKTPKRMDETEIGMTDTAAQTSFRIESTKSGGV